MQYKYFFIFYLVLSINYANSNEESGSNKQHNDSNVKQYRLNAVNIVDKAIFDSKYQSNNTINNTIIESNPTGNGDITSILRILPNVQYDNAQLQSTTPGEIDPANISISGGLYYQNNFLIDGFNMNNDLDPSISGGNYNAVGVTALPGRSQGLNIDTSLLESINVQDSNISAAYGGFTGGVVEANTKKATKKFGAKISYQITQGNAETNAISLTRYHIYGDANDFLNSTSDSNQPNFIKHIVRSSFESKMNDNAGVIASLITTQSFIPLNAYAATQISSTLDSVRKEQKRQSYNLYVKGHYDIGESIRLEASYAYMPQFNNYFIVNTRNSDFDMLTGGHQAGIKSFWDNAIGNLTTQANFNYLDNSRTNSATNMYIWRYSTDKNWNPNGNNSEGGYGNVDSKQITFTTKIHQDFESFSIKFWENHLNTGIELGYVNAYYERLEDTMIGNIGFNRPMSGSCTDLIWCSNGIVDITNLSQALQNIWRDNQGQYASRITLYEAGKINLHNFTLASYVEDDMKFDIGKYGSINARFGLRLDYDTYMNKVAIAPRFSLNFIAPWKNWDRGKYFVTQVSFGANRYYGRNLFAYRLYDARSALQVTLNRSAENIAWENAAITRNKNDTNFQQLRIPYADELMVGFVQKFFMFNLNAKYIHRFGRDEVRRMCQAPNGSLSSLNCTSNVAGLTQDLHYVYTNEGRSETDVITIALQHDTPLEFFGIKNSILFAFDWTNIKRNYADYSVVLENAELANQWISYDGILIRYADKPAENFVRPYTFRLTTTHTFSIWKIKALWNNFFRFRSGYTTMASVTNETDKDSFVIDGVLQTVDTFRPYNIKWAFTWDIRLGFEIPLYSRNILFVNLDIYNVLDAKNIAIASVAYSTQAGTTAIPIYEVGRQFWLEVGYRF